MCDERVCQCFTCSKNLLSILFYDPKKISDDIIETALGRSQDNFRSAFAYLCHRLDLIDKGDSEIVRDSQALGLSNVALIAKIPGLSNSAIQLGANHLLATPRSTFFTACMTIAREFKVNVPFRGPLHNYTYSTTAHASPGATGGAGLSARPANSMLGCGCARQDDVELVLHRLSVSGPAQADGTPKKPAADSEMPELVPDSEAGDTKEEAADDSNNLPLLDISILPPAVLKIFASALSLHAMAGDMVALDRPDGRVILMPPGGNLARLWTLARSAHGAGLGGGGTHHDNDLATYPADEIEDLIHQLVKRAMATEEAKAPKRDQVNQPPEKGANPMSFVMDETPPNMLVGGGGDIRLNARMTATTTRRVADKNIRD